MDEDSSNSKIKSKSILLHLKVTISALAAVAVSAVLILLLHTHGKLILTEYLLYYLWLIPSILLIETIRYCYINKQEEDKINTDLIPGFILFLFLLIALVSSLNHYRWFYFLVWRHAHTPDFGFFRAGIIQFIFIAQLLIPIFFLAKKKISLLAAVIMICSQILCFGAIMYKTGGLALYRDDHARFIYRIWQFSKTFPQFINYNPNWNSGIIDCSGISTGAVSLGFLFWPIWKLVPVESVYTHIYAITFIIIVPLLYVFSLRTIGRDWTSAFVAGLLSLGVSHYYFLWLLRYGTPGALITSAMIVPFMSCIYRIVWLDKREWWLAAALVLSGFFLVLWPPGIIIGAGVIFSLIFSFKKLSRNKVLFLILCFAGFFILYFKIFAALIALNMTGEVSKHFDCQGRGGFWSVIQPDILRTGWIHLSAVIKEGNPLLIFFGIGGIFFIPEKSIKRWFLPVLIFLILLSGWGREVNDDLQFTRMAIPMFFVSVVPASVWISRFLNIQNTRLIVLRSMLIALLALIGLNCAKIYMNKSYFNFTTLPPEITEMADWVQRYTPADGRILLAGPTRQAYGGGGVEVLPYLFKRELITGDFNCFETIEGSSDFISEEVKCSKEELFNFIELHNISCIITWEEAWKDVFRAYSDQYVERTKIAGKSIFTVNRKADMFLKGSGSVNADFNKLVVHPVNPTEDIVIKYNWIEGLSTGGEAHIFPFDAGYGARFIGIKPNGEEEIVIEYEV